jgi:hypothetical protein
MAINKTTSILYYMKYPTTPVYDYYIDVNGNYQYLAEGATHVWTTGEKDSQGNTKTTGDPNYSSLTIECEWKDQDKLAITSKILRYMGIHLDEGEVLQYAQEMKTEQR